MQKISISAQSYILIILHMFLENLKIWRNACLISCGMSRKIFPWHHQPLTWTVDILQVYFINPTDWARSNTVLLSVQEYLISCLTLHWFCLKWCVNLRKEHPENKILDWMKWLFVVKSKEWTESNSLPFPVECLRR